MTTFRRLLPLVPGIVLLTACGGSGPSDDDGVVDCAGVEPTTLAVGETTIIDARERGCVRLPAAGGAGAEHLYVALSGEGDETQNGVQADYQLQGGTPAGAARMHRATGRAPSRLTGPAGRFHDLLRRREAELAPDGGGNAAARRAAVRRPPSVGDERTFKVCETTRCETFVDVAATARVVAQRVAVYLDDEVPTSGYTDFDLQEVASLFDDHLYRIDTTAFGRESDIDDNDVVIVLLTPRINLLSGSCNSSGSVILGYFFGLDLLAARPNSNAGEVFYGLVPDPNNSTCTISKSFALGFLPPVFIHEFQHMISYNQHVLEGGGLSPESTWLNEGLSHFAEELGGREIPDAECQPLFETCESQFIGANLENAYDYLDDPEASFLVEPVSSQGDIAERGANWLFVRWLVDHFATQQPLGGDFTRRLVQTASTGRANVEAATGESFADLVAQWQLANYAEDLPGFTPLDPRLQYTSWNLREAYQLNFDDGVFAKPYPLTPLTTDGNIDISGVLRGGSGVHLLVQQPASAPEVELRLTGDDGERAVEQAALPRIALLRIR